MSAKGKEDEAVIHSSPENVVVISFRTSVAVTKFSNAEGQALADLLRS